MDDKIAFMSQFEFGIAFENSSYPGYTTDKLLDAFEAGTVPIYWGDPLVGHDFHERAFVNCHSHSSDGEMVRRIRQLQSEPDLYARDPVRTLVPRWCRSEVCRPREAGTVASRAHQFGIQAGLATAWLPKRSGATNHRSLACPAAVPFEAEIVRASHRSITNQIRVGDQGDPNRDHRDRAIALP